MVEAATEPAVGAVEEGPEGRRWWRWLVAILLAIPLMLALLFPAGLWFLSETARGRAYVAERISGLSPESGLTFDVGRIDGSLMSRFSMQDVVVNDLDGRLVELPVVNVDWDPVTLVRRLVSINRIEVPEGRMLRMWRINPRDPDEPLLPDINVRIDRFELANFRLEEAVAGRADVLAANGRTEIRSGRLLFESLVKAASGDRLVVRMDAEPEANRLDINARLAAPAGGLVSTLAAIDAPLGLALEGAGTWARWRGRLDADHGDVRVAALAIEADDGRFRFTGDLDAAPFVDGAVANLLAPALGVDITASREGEAFALRFIAQSPALAISGGGAIDTTRNRFQALRAEILLKQPQLANAALAGSGMRAAITVDGPIADPAIGWSAAAASLRLAGDGGPVGVDGLQAEGTVRLAGKGRPLSVPFTATAVSTHGLPPEMAALLASPRLGGTLSFADGTLRGSGLTLTTAKMQASGEANLFADGRATAILNADVPRLDVPQLGPVALQAVAQIRRAPGAAPAVDGRFEARSLGLINAGAKDFLGGLPNASGGFALSPDGVIRVSDARLNSPNLTFAGASGSYDPANGRFTLNAAGNSRAYGPVTIVASGTSTAPRATVKLASPGFGIGITDLVAELEPATGGFLITGTANSSQGPIDGRVILYLGEGQPLSIDVQRIAIAGLSARGRLVQTAAGPFGGILSIESPGLEAELAFSAQGKLQRIDGRGEAVNARIPLAVPIAIAKGSTSFTILLVPDAPHVNGRFQLTGLRRDALALTSASGDVNIAGGKGAGTVRLAGRQGAGQPFAATARLQTVGDGFGVALDGMVGKLPLKLEHPARITRVAGGWALAPARLILPKGTVMFAGEWGKTRELRAVLTDVDLGILDLVSRDFGLGGTASGQLALRSAPGSPVPQGEANIRISRLTRSDVSGVSIPIDVHVAANSSNGGLVLGARMTWQDNLLGRLVLRVDPGEGEDVAAKFLAGAMSGGIRYNGPIEPIWALFGLEGQDMRGPIAIAADFGGTPASPQLRGQASGSGIVYRNATLGTEILDIRFSGRFAGPTLEIVSMDGRANGGTLKGSGTINLSAGDARGINLALDLDRARLANSDTIETTLSGPLRLQGKGNSATLSGDLRVDSARIQLVQLETSEVPQLRVRRAGEIRVPAREQALSASSLKLDVRVRADNGIRVEGMGLESEWRADIRVRGDAAAPIFLGTAVLVRGEFVFAGSDFELSSGRVTFNGKPLDSSLNIQAQTIAEDVTAFVNIRGTAARPEVSFTSVPSLPEDEILSRLLFGSSVANLSVTEALQLATAIAGLQSGTDTMGKIRRSVGVDRLRLVGGDDATGMGTGLAIGKRLTRNLYVEVLTDGQGNTLTTVQWTLSRVLSLLLEVSTVGNNSANLRYSREN